MQSKGTQVSGRDVDEMIVIGASDVPLDWHMPHMSEGEERDALYRQMYRYAKDMNTLIERNASAEVEMRMLRVDALLRLATTLTMADGEQQASMIRVAFLSGVVANELQLSEKYCRSISLAAALRNIGMLGVRVNRQSNPDKWCTQSESALKGHPLIGAAILGGGDSTELQMAEEVALGHHERFDGKGYPYGRSGRMIPLSARIVSAVEWLDERLSNSSNRGPETLEGVVQTLRHQANLALDPLVTIAVVECAPLFIKVREEVERLGGEVILDLEEALLRLSRKFLG
jgi:putative two-component system response regulator